MNKFFTQVIKFASHPHPPLLIAMGSCEYVAVWWHLQKIPNLTCGSEDIWEYHACLPQPHIHRVQTDHQLIMAFPDP